MRRRGGQEGPGQLVQGLEGQGENSSWALWGMSNIPGPCHLAGAAPHDNPRCPQTWSWVRTTSPNAFLFFTSPAKTYDLPS